MIKVLIIEDHKVTRDGLRSALQEFTELEISGATADSVSGLRLAEELQPDVVLLDLHLPGPLGPRKSSVNRDEFELLLRSLFKDMIYKSMSDSQQAPLFPRALAEQSLAPAVSELLRERDELTRTLIADQESVRNSIAGDIHDNILSELLYLRRCFSGKSRLTDNEVVAIIDGISAQLRSLCHDLAPRDLEEWGLSVALEDLATRVCRRAGLQLAFSAPPDLTRLPLEVETQIYRIMQESLNNVEKHAQASVVRFEIELSVHSLHFTVIDDGLGLQLSAPSAHTGGSGKKIMRERTQFISHLFPARLSMQQLQPTGTSISLVIDLPGEDSIQSEHGRQARDSTV